MRVLEGLQPKKVFYYFEEISRIPRGSGNTKAVSDYCVQFAKERNLWVKQDELNNVIIKKPATMGRENSPAVILQGHLDMVAEKTNTSTHDFMKDGLKLKVEGDFVTADETTLGADNGIAIAMALAVLDTDNISHPDLEVLFTVDEETGMEGAQNIDMSDFKAKYLLNLDCDMEDTLMAGCAGGVRVDVSFDIERKEILGNYYQIKVNGLKGGHSGSEIDKDRANANIVLARILYMISKYTDGLYIEEFTGGNKDNAIPREACANVVVTNDAFDLKACAYYAIAGIKKEYSLTDPDLNLDIEEKRNVCKNVWNSECSNRVIEYLNAIPNGATRMSNDFSLLVETSLNLGIAKTTEDAFCITHTIRSIINSKKQELKDKVVLIAKLSGAKAKILSDYPEWEYKRDSYLQTKLTEIYKKEFDRELKVDVIHAGLECGYLLEKMPDLDAVSFGPVMYDIHTTEERLSISSTKLTYDFLIKILEELV